MQDSDLQSNDLYSVPESIVMQNLTHFFITPSAKQLPYYSFFYNHHNSSLYALSYIYNFVRTPIRPSTIEQLMTKLFQKQDGQQYDQAEIIRSVLDQILSCNAYIDRKTLIARYISLPSMLGELLVRKKTNGRKLEQKIVEQVCEVVERLNLEEKVFIINKIILIGHVRILLKPKNIPTIQQNYLYVVKKQAVILFLIERYLQEDTSIRSQEILQNFLTIYHETENHSLILNILHREFFIPSHAQPIHTLLSTFPNIQQSLFNDLLVWWSQGIDNYMVYNMIKFRANLLTLFIKSLPQSRIIQCSGIIALGIERRLITLAQNRKQAVNLVWGQLGKKLKIQLNINVSAELLKDEEQSQSSRALIKDQSQRQEEKEVEMKKKGESKTKVFQVFQNEKKPQEQETGSQEDKQIYELVPKAPRNLYDCILGLRNPSRKQTVLKSLPNMIRLNPDDLLFIWRDLIQQLICCLNEDTKQSCVSLFVTKPDNFIESVAQLFFSKQASLNDKIILMEVLSDGVEQLSYRPKEVQQEKQSKQFYFKKVRSKYYKEDEQKQGESSKRQERTRRWGHTRIAFEQKLKKPSNGISLFVLKNEPYVNRLYEVAVKLFFKIISRLTMVSIFPSEPMLTNPLLKLLGTLSSNLKNHIEKYKILGEVVQNCLQVIEHIEGKPKQAQEKAKHLKKWKDTNLNVLNTLNKVSLVLDKYIPEKMLVNLEKCIQKLKHAKQYGIAPIISMIEANIYTNVSGQPTTF